MYCLPVLEAGSQTFGMVGSSCGLWGTMCSMPLSSLLVALGTTAWLVDGDLLPVSSYHLPTVKVCGSQTCLLISSVQFSHSVVSSSLRPHGLQHARLPCPSPTCGACSTPTHQVGNAIQLSHPLLSPSPSAFNLSQHQSLFQWVSSYKDTRQIGLGPCISLIICKELICK